MTALSDALTAAQRSALGALEKAYVAGAIEAEAMSEAMESCGITDAVDRAFLIASLDILKEWGVSAPNLTERLARENGEPEKASDKQRQLIMDLCKRKNVPSPNLAGLSKPKASELIDSLNDGSYDPANWPSIPFWGARRTWRRRRFRSGTRSAARTTRTRSTSACSAHPPPPLKGWPTPRLAAAPAARPSRRSGAHAGSTSRPAREPGRSSSER